MWWGDSLPYKPVDLSLIPKIQVKQSRYKVDMCQQ